MSEYHMLRIRAALYEDLKVAAEKEELSVASYVSRVLRLHLNAQQPKKPEASINPAHAGLSPQARAALTKEEAKKARANEERLAKAARLPEMHDGYEVYRYGITEDWSPANAGYGYTAMVNSLPTGEVFYVRVPDEDREQLNTVRIPRFIPERKARDLPDDWDAIWADDE